MMSTHRPRGTSFDQQSVVTQNPRGESFDATRPRIDSTGLGRPRIDSSVDLGTRLDPPTPESSINSVLRSTTREGTHQQGPRSFGTLSQDGLSSTVSSSASSSSLFSPNNTANNFTKGTTFAKGSSTFLPNTISSSNHNAFPSHSTNVARNTPPTSGKSVKSQAPSSPRAPRLDPTKPLPHQVGLNKNKRSPESELHTSNAYGASAAKKMKVNEKESLATAYGKPATVLGADQRTHEKMVPPKSAPISLSHFSGTWKLDTEKSETLYS
jgi:hypothetical protein